MGRCRGRNWGATLAGGAPADIERAGIQQRIAAHLRLWKSWEESKSHGGRLSAADRAASITLYRSTASTSQQDKKFMSSAVNYTSTTCQPTMAVDGSGNRRSTAMPLKKQAKTTGVDG